MANEEQLEILKQGVEAWNNWREENPKVRVHLDEAFFPNGIELVGVNFFRAELRETKLWNANLRGANLMDAHLGGADIIGCNLDGAILKGAVLAWARLNATSLDSAHFELSLMEHTVFANLDLSKTLGLGYVHHRRPSIIGTETFFVSKGQIPRVFLRGCGLSDWEIEAVKLYHPNLNHEEVNKILYNIYELRATQALQISPLFISYSHADGEFVARISKSLTKKGIRYWLDTHEMKAGRMEKQIDRAIRQNPTVLLVLSEHSLSSDWVEHEVRTARDLEKEMGRDVLCPVALDNSWKSSRWPKRVMEQIMEYNILDFSEWKDDSKFGNTFNKLIDGLELFYKG